MVNLEKELFHFEGKVDCIDSGQNRPGYTFLRIISEKKDKFIGWTKQVPPYIKEGKTTRISYKLDKDKEYLIVAFTIP